VTLNSLKQNKGIGTLLTNELKKISEEKNCKRIWTITTNDNLNGLKFYQNRGFTIKAVYPNAVQKSRKFKPQIPLVGENGIPIKDEIALELKI